MQTPRQTGAANCIIDLDHRDGVSFSDGAFHPVRIRDRPRNGIVLTATSAGMAILHTLLGTSHGGKEGCQNPRWSLSRRTPEATRSITASFCPSVCSDPTRDAAIAAASAVRAMTIAVRHPQRSDAAAETPACPASPHADNPATSPAPPAPVQVRAAHTDTRTPAPPACEARCYASAPRARTTSR